MTKAGTTTRSRKKCKRRVKQDEDKFRKNARKNASANASSTKAGNAKINVKGTLSTKTLKQPGARSTGRNKGKTGPPGKSKHR